MATEKLSERWIADSHSKLGSCECTPALVEAKGADPNNEDLPCLSAPVVAAAAKIVGLPRAAAANATAVVATAKEEAGCSGQRCLVDFLERQGHIAPETAKQEKELNLKPEGPADSAKWLTNHNLDATTGTWERTFQGFKSIPTAMMNFTEYDCALGKFDPAAFAAANGSAFGCVLNTDHYPGKGKHWVCVFGDLRGASAPWTLEYFNSSGRPPPVKCVEWMVTQRNRLRALRRKLAGQRRPSPDAVSVDDVVVNARAHQSGNTECGVYCLFYLWCRLTGVPYENFRRSRVADEKMKAFRKNLFTPIE
jgi:hypothetical protein